MQLNRLERIITRCKSAAGFNMQEQNGLETQQPLDLHVCSRQVICLLTNLTKITVRVLSWSHSFPPSVDQYQGELQQAKLIVQVEVRRFTDPLKHAVSSVDRDGERKQSDAGDGAEGATPQDARPSAARSVGRLMLRIFKVTLIRNAGATIPEIWLVLLGSTQKIVSLIKENLNRLNIWDKVK